MIIRPEQVGDERAIFDLTLEAFEPMPFSDGAEPLIIDGLRKNGDLVVSLVAVDQAEIVGHVAFSPVTLNGNPGSWFGLGPLSVRIDRQKTGIGSQLVKRGLAEIKKRGAVGCALIGDPAYYGRFGFLSDGELTYGDVPLQYVQWLSFGAERARGVLKYAPAFDVEGTS